MKYLFKIITTLITVLVLMKISAGVSFAKSNCDGLDYSKYKSSNVSHPAISANDEDVCKMQDVSIMWQCESEKRGLSCNEKDSNIHNKTSLNNSTNKLPNRCSTFKYSFYGYTKKLVAKSTDSKVCRFSLNPKQTGWDEVSNNCPFIIEAINRNFSVRDCLNILKSETDVNKSDVSICNLATDYGKWTSVRFREEFIEEAKRRGLTCGVKDEEEEKQKQLERETRLKLEQEKIKKKAEKIRTQQIEKENRLKVEQEKIKKKAAEVARKKRLKEEKERKKKLVQEKARKKKLAETERKRKLAQEQLNKKIINYKREAKNFYKDIENFVKNEGDIDLVNLYKLYNVKPNPKNKWNTQDLSNYEKLRKFMTSNLQFVSYERERIGKRLKNSFALKDQSIVDLNSNLSELKTLMRKMFGSKEIPKIMSMISDIETTLSDFKQSIANNVIKKSSTYIASKSPKPKVEKTTTKVTSSSDTNWSKVKNDLTIQQQQFCQLTDRFYDNLNKARKSKNEIKVNVVHKERQENLDALIPQGNISNWIFKVIKIDQVEDGSAAVVLGLQCKSYVGSGQTIDIKRGMSRKDKKQWRATIPYNDRRFRELAKLDQGQFIVGSGTMLEINAYKPGQKETFYASQQIGDHPLTKDLNLEGELFITDLSYIAALN